jgi:molecular chaperone IbpA
VVRYGKGKYGLELALAGYDKKNVLVEFKNGVLTVEGEVDEKQKDYIHQGLALRKFSRQFQLRNDVIVDEAEMKNGVLTIKLGVNEPEELEAVKIDIK